MKYVSIDIETTGLDETKCGIIEFAAVIEDTCSATPEKELPRFQRFLKLPTGIVWEEVAAQWNEKRYLKNYNEAIDPKNLAGEFEIWLRVNGISPHKFSVAGKNFQSFDYRFLCAKQPTLGGSLIEMIPGWKECIVHHYRVLDPAILFFDPKVDDVLPDTVTCATRAGFSIAPEKRHTALEDARFVVSLLRAGLSPYQKDHV